MSVPETKSRKQLKEYYENNNNPPVSEWDNYGDVNPEAHGGIWVSYDPEYAVWTVYETIHMGAYEHLDDPENYGKQYVRSAEVGWKDLYTEEGNFRIGKFGGFKRTVESMNCTQHPEGIVIDGDLTRAVAWYAAERGDPFGGDNGVRTGEYDRESYDDVLRAIGVKQRE